MLSINVVSTIFLIEYIISYFIIRRKKDLTLFLLFLIFFLPKINIIGVGKMTTAGIRIDDLIILFLLLKNYRKSTYKNRYVQKGVQLLLLLTTANIISVITGIFIGLNSNILYPILVLVRKFEYFSLIFIGFNMAKKYSYNMNALENEYIRLNVYLAIIGFMQLFHLCNYAVSGSESDIFSGLVVSTFNGYYEYGQFLIFSLLFFMLKIPKAQRKIKYIILFVISFILLYYTNSRTSLLCFLILFLGFLFLNKSKEKSVSLFKIVTICIFTIILSLILLKKINIDLGRLSNISISMLIGNFTNQFKQTNFQQYYSMVKRGIRVTTMLGNTNDLSTSIRFFKWSAAIDGFFKYPLFGYGIGIFHVMDGNYIRLLGETGIIGLFLWMKYYCYYLNVFKKRKQVKILFYFIYLSMISVLISSTFIDMFDASKIMEFLWLIIGVGCSIISNMELDNSKES